MPGSPWVLRYLSLDRLEIVIAADSASSRTRLHHEGISNFCRQMGWNLKQAQIPRHHIQKKYPVFTGKWRPFSSHPLRTRQLVFLWGSENIQYGTDFDGYHVEECMGALHGWQLTLLREAGVISGIEATRNTVEHGGWDN